MSTENPLMENTLPSRTITVDETKHPPHLATPDSPPDASLLLGQDHRVERLLETIKSQNDDRISFQRSTHELIVDLSSRVRQITDDAFSRAQRSMFLEIVMLHDSLDQVLAWIRTSDAPQSREAVLDLGRDATGRIAGNSDAARGSPLRWRSPRARPAIAPGNSNLAHVLTAD